MANTPKTKTSSSPPPPFLVTDDPSLGKQFVASRDLKAGDLILRESPIIAIPSWPNDDPNFDRQAACLTCATVVDLDDQNTYKKCASCTWPVCSVNCEANPVHGANECKIFSSLKFHFPPSSAIFTPKRIDWLIFAVRVSLLKKREPDLYKNLLKLKDTPDLPLPGEMGAMLELASETVTTCPLFLEGSHAAELAGSEDSVGESGGLGLTRDEMTRLIWIFKLNGFTCATAHEEDFEHDRLLDYDEDSGQQKMRRPFSSAATMDCIYLVTSRINNSCAPTCTYLTNNKFPHLDIVIRTAVEVKSGQPLTINYFPYHHLPTTIRRQRIRESFLFHCQCERCLDPTEMGTNMAAILCSFCHGDEVDHEENCFENYYEQSDLGYFLPVFDHPDGDQNDQIDQTLWKCHKCGRTQSAASLPPLLGLQKIVEELQPGKLDEGLRHSQDEEFLKNLVENRRKYGLHPNHWILQLAIGKLLSFYKNLATYKQLCGEQLKFCTKYSLHNLQIQEKFFPGRSIVKACLQLDLCTALFENLMMSSMEEDEDCGQFLKNQKIGLQIEDKGKDGRQELKKNEKIQNAVLCRDLAREALVVFDSFKNDDASGYYELCQEFLEVVKKSAEDELQV